MQRDSTSGEEEKLIKAAAVLAGPLIFDGDALIEDERSSDRVHVINLVCASRGAAGSARYEFTNEIHWSRDD